ncbi:DNA primase [Tahibacter harae]|uniref:DNA primase n=1 Tax=Tahibacter harae TaxID=2963937 RepID=A0ABT1QZ98_9GAMM|nr:DNA primase [Tahibacter harae]MCQ4167614.1 DNA primase [Tahibacter harae]
MAGRIPDSFIDELLARVDIVDVIQERVPLKKAGREYSARCPFHDERSPSFTVSPHKQFYHCFGCGAHGSAIKFLMDYDRLEFPDAIEELAARIGLKVPYEGGRSAAPAQSDSADLYTVLDQAARYYQRALADSPAARAYFDNRGLDARILQAFGLGYAPDAYDGLRSALGGSPQRLALLEKSGMLARGDRGVYDRFRDRVMFPIQDRRGRVIAFGGRVLEKSDGPKYLNSPETPLFHKGRELFALWQVRQAQQKISRILVVEGYMDVIALHQHGLPQAVATLGTATTREHAEILFRNSADVYFCFDGDRAGRQAAWRAVESVLPRMRDGRQAHFLFLPEGEDPDSLIRQEGSAGFEQRLSQATALSDFFFAHQEAGTDLRTADGRARLAERCKELIGGIPEGAFRDRMLEILTDKTAIRWSLAASLSPQMREMVEESLADRVAELRGTPAPTLANESIAVQKSGNSGNVAKRSLVRHTVALLLQHPEFIESAQPPYGFAALRQPGIPLLLELLEFCRARPAANSAAILEHFKDRDEAAALHKLAVIDLHGDGNSLQQEFAGTLKMLETQTTQQRTDDLIEKERQVGLSPEERAELRDLFAARRR